MFGDFQCISDLTSGGSFNKKDVELLLDWLDEEDDEYEEVKRFWEEIECYHEEYFVVGDEALKKKVQEELDEQGVEIPGYIFCHVDWGAVVRDRMPDIQSYELDGEDVYAF